MITESDILFQDEELVAINKPANLLVHRSEIDKHETENLVQLTRELIGQVVYPAHRLDKPTSGVILFALSKSSLKLLREQFEALTINKRYHAVTRGHIRQDLNIDHPLKEKPAFKTQDKSELKVQPAETKVTIIEHFTFAIPVDRYPEARYSLAELRPVTGRRHQLRRHMKHISHPILGDTNYGKTTHNQLFRNHFSCHRLMLHATEISLTHPSQGVKLNIKAPYTECFDKVIQQMKQESL